MTKSLYIGLMSGTSMDGIDASVVEVDDDSGLVTSEVGNIYLPYLESFRVRCRQAEARMQETKGGARFSEFVSEFEQELTYLHIDAIWKLLQETDLKPNQIEAIGFHGQTLYHKPSDAITIQVGDGQLMANSTGMVVVNDFRSEDVLAGGQGAPLVPIYHRALAIKQNLIPLVIINCGGIANITFVGSVRESDLIGFDTGPGNILIDRYIREKTNNLELIDEDGKYGSAGKVNQEVSNILLQESIATSDINYFERKAPKSLCASDIKLPQQIYNLSIQDASATLAAFTAETILIGLKSLKATSFNIVLAGGGWHNPVITNYLKSGLDKIDSDIRLLEIQDLAWNIDSMEAAAFGFLAYRSIHNLPISFPNTTGVSRAMVGGKTYEPQLFMIQ